MIKIFQTIGKLTKGPSPFNIIKNIPKSYFGGGGHHHIAHDKIVLRNQKTGYYLDPWDVSRRFIKLIALHDGVKNPD